MALTIQLSDYQRLQKILNYLLLLPLIIALLIQIGCAGRVRTEPTIVGEEGRARGQWLGKALVRDFKSGQSAVLALDVVAQEPSLLRMEVVGAFGVHVASVALMGDTVSYSLTQEKRFIVASANSGAIGHLMPVYISPRDLLAVLFDRDLPAPDWTCEVEAGSGLRKICKHQTKMLSIEWVKRERLSRRLKINAVEAGVELLLQEGRSKVEFSDGTFVLTPPTGYSFERRF